jgi:hypothetical protein
VVRNMMIVGLGLGPTMPVFTIAAQNAVSFSQLGVVTSVTQFARSIGGTLGAALFGSLVVNRFGAALQEALPPTAAAVIPAEQLARIQNPQVLLNPQISASIREGLSAAGPRAAQAYDTLIAAIRTALAASLHETFLSGAAIVAVGALVVVFLPEIPLRKSFADAPGDGATGAPERGTGQVPPMAAASTPVDGNPLA